MYIYLYIYMFIYKSGTKKWPRNTINSNNKVHSNEPNVLKMERIKPLKASDPGRVPSDPIALKSWTGLGFNPLRKGHEAILVGEVTSKTPKGFGSFQGPHFSRVFAVKLRESIVSLVGG